jgi:hypothetical protein
VLFLEHSQLNKYPIGYLMIGVRRLSIFVLSPVPQLGHLGRIHAAFDCCLSSNLYTNRVIIA